MISAATAATAVLMVTLVKDYGLQYLLVATVLAGLFQIMAGLLKLGFVMRFVSRSVMTGFVNALATLIFMAQLPDSLPVFLLADIPLNLETLQIILPYSAAVAAVGLLESLVTASIADELTDTRSDKNRGCIGKGIANTATGFIGGMVGCVMIGQFIVNVKSGGRGIGSIYLMPESTVSWVSRLVTRTTDNWPHK